MVVKSMGCSTNSSTPLNPTENGLVERSMQGINKIASITKLNKSSFQEALADYVACYNSWPHSVTKVPPAELMFGRPVRTLFPNPKLNQPVGPDEELRDRDLLAKFTRNKAEDKRRNAGPTDIRIGDLVLVIQQKHDKADSIYKKVLHRVMKIEGLGRVTLMDQDTGRIYDRNVKQLKKYVDRKEDSTPQTKVVAEEVEASALTDDGEEPIKVNVPTPTIVDEGEPLPKRRSARNIGPPKRLDDFQR